MFQLFGYYYILLRPCLPPRWHKAAAGQQRRVFGRFLAVGPAGSHGRLQEQEGDPTPSDHATDGQAPHAEEAS